MTFDPHSGEEALQRATDAESGNKFGKERYAFEPPVDESDLGGGHTPTIAESQESIRKSIEAAKVKRESQARDKLGLPPVNPE